MTIRALVALAAALALGAAAGCGGSSKTTTSASTPPPPAPQAPPPAPKPPVTTIRIVVRDGKVVGGLEQATLKKGDKAVLVVSADLADEVHFHGYDLSAEVEPGSPARIAFTASIPGRFVVELENRGLEIASLEVRP